MRQGERSLGIPGVATVGSRLWQGGYAEDYHHRRQCGKRFGTKQGNAGMAVLRHLRKGGATEERRDHR